MEDIECIEILDIHRNRRSTWDDPLTYALLCKESDREDCIAAIMVRHGECPSGEDWVTWFSRQN